MRIAAFTLFLASLLSSSVYAEEFYIGASAGIAQYSAKSLAVPSGGDYDPSTVVSFDAAWIYEDIIFELSYQDYEKFEFNSNVLTNSFFNMETLQFAIGAQRRMTKRIDLEFKIGLVMWNADGTFEGTNIGEVEDGNSTSITGSVEYNFSKRLSALGGYRHVRETLGGASLNNANLGIRYYF